MARNKTTWTKGNAPVPPHPLRKMTSESLDQAKQLWSVGASTKEIAKRFGVSDSTMVSHCGRRSDNPLETIQCRECKETKNKTYFVGGGRRLGRVCSECRMIKKANSLGTFRINLLEYRRLLEVQNSACAICKVQDPSSARKRSGRFSIDHDHVTGIVRGLLCHKCNALLGLAGEHIEVLESAISYLRKQTVGDGPADAQKDCEKVNDNGIF